MGVVIFSGNVFGLSAAYLINRLASSNAFSSLAWSFISKSSRS
jgi:hypothetical protein